LSAKPDNDSEELPALESRLSVSSYESQSMLSLAFASGVIDARKSDICIPESSN